MGQDTALENDIAQAIRQSRGGCVAAGTIANKVGKNRYLVRSVLDRMVRQGRLECVGNGDEALDRFRLVIGAKAISAPVVTLRPFVAPVPAEVIAFDDGDAEPGDAGEEDDVLLTASKREAAYAAVLWKERMGDARWHDDPRARRDSLPINLRAPFLSNLPRD